MRLLGWFATCLYCASCTLLVDTTGLTTSGAGPGAADGAPEDAAGDGTDDAPADALADVAPEGDGGIPSTAVTWTTGAGANGHSYEVVVAPGITWLDAKSAASARAGHLATITSAEENAFVAALVAAKPAATGANSWGPWLGGHQLDGSVEPDGGWTWITGEGWGFAAWAPAEPNGAPGENALGFFKAPSWGDYVDTQSYGNGYVVEYE